MKTLRLICVALVFLMVGVPVAQAQTPAEIESALKAAYTKYKDLHEGKNADYIPALAKVDSNLFGIALVMVDGKERAAMPSLSARRRFPRSSPAPASRRSVAGCSSFSPN